MSLIVAGPGRAGTPDRPRRAYTVERDAPSTRQTIASGHWCSIATWAASPAGSAAPISAAARTISFSMVSCPTLRSACRNARSSGGPARPLTLQRLLASGKDVVPPGRQPGAPPPELPRQRLQRLATLDLGGNRPATATALLIVLLVV